MKIINSKGGNSMKLKKVVVTLIVFIMVLSMIAGFSNVKAETADYKLGIVRLRKSGYGYKIVPTGSTEKTIWKIVSYDASGTVNYDKAIYCIKAGQGFGDSWTSENISNTVDNIKSHLNEALEDEKKYVKIFRTSGVLAGFLIAIILA